MAQGTLRSEQGDFGAGIYRGREAPDNAAYDLLNCLIDDEGQPFRRGGSAYKSNANAGSTLEGLADVQLDVGQRTLMWSQTGAAVYGLSADDATPVTLLSGAGYMGRFARPTFALGAVWVPGYTAAGDGQALVYAGSRKAASYSTGSVTTTVGSAVVTGTGTSWLANVDAGMFLQVNSGAGIGFKGPVKSVDSNTQLTLVYPITGVASVTALYSLGRVESNALTIGLGTFPGEQVYLAAAGGRLFFAVANRIYYSGLSIMNNASVFADYIDMVAGGRIIGMTQTGDDGILVFTTAGTWTVDNLSFDPLDDAGNVQWIQRRANELVLLGDPGLASWRGAVVAPCVDNVWLVPQGEAPVPIGDPIRPLYLSYVKAGYQPGTASVHRGHYFLPIVNGATLVDVLVCRLDRGFAWTRWSGHGAGTAYAQRVGSTTRSPKLFSVNGQRVTDLTDAWSPSASNASEADATTHPLTIETRDLSTGSGAKGATTRKVRIRYQATAAATPTITVSYARGPEDAAYTSLGTAVRGGAASDGLDESVWPVGKQAPAIRFRISSTSALSTFTLREISVEYTPRGA